MWPELVKDKLSRRKFLTVLSSTPLYSLITLNSSDEKEKERGEMRKTEVVVLRTESREQGISKALSMLDLSGKFRNQKVMIKPNFNTADPFPASTHNETLVELVKELRQRGVDSLTVGERSGPPPTEEVFQDKDIYKLSEELGFQLINFDQLSPEDLHFCQPNNSHWADGFRVARPLIEADRVVATCCLKTHQYGGKFTMSLKLAVGIVPREGYDYMSELHSSPDMRKMIAEINQAYTPDLILMDAMEIFTDGGPAFGQRETANLIIAGTDRVAVDAVGLAVLKHRGSNEDIMEPEIFEQEQIRRAVELDLGVQSPEQISLVGDDKSEQIISDLRDQLE
ncbi:MAG: DUF362 domain-containing protein [Candidatus Bipolaricaulota bacterium]